MTYIPSTGAPVVAIYQITAATSNPVVADAIYEVVDYDTKIKDTHNAVTTGPAWKFVAPMTGYYRVSANFLWNNVTNLSSGFLTLTKNGAQYAVFNNPYTAANFVSSGTTVVYLTSGEYIAIEVYQDDSTGASRSINTNTNRYLVSIESV